jgi:hypothetical protein
MSLDNLSIEIEPEALKSNRSSKRSLFTQFLNVNEIKQPDFAEQFKFVKTPREKKILFAKDANFNRLRKHFFDDNIIVTEEDKKWYPLSNYSTELQEQIDNLEKSIKELLDNNHTNFYLHDIKQREKKIIENELRDVKELRNRSITDRAMLTNELDYVRVS